MNQTELSAALEAMLFAYGEPIGADKLAQALGQPQAAVEAGLEKLQASYLRPSCGLCLLQLEDRWQLASKNQQAVWAGCWTPARRCPWDRLRWRR